jgi:hypothetical protein
MARRDLPIGEVTRVRGDGSIESLEKVLVLTRVRSAVTGQLGRLREVLEVELAKVRRLEREAPDEEDAD